MKPLLFGIALTLTLTLPVPSEASFGESLKVFAAVCGMGPYRFPDDKSATKWLHQHMAFLRPNQKERYMLGQWPTAGVTRSINEPLRRGQEPDRSRVIDSDPHFTRGDLMDLMDRLQPDAFLLYPIVAYRGVGESDIGDVKVGDVVTDPGYMNLSLRREVPEIWGRYNSPEGGHKILELTLPKGSTAVPVGRLGLDDNRQLYGGELTIVPPRGTKFRVTGVEEQRNGTTVIKGVVVP